MNLTNYGTCVLNFAYCRLFLCVCVSGLHSRPRVVPAAAWRGDALRSGSHHHVQAAVAHNHSVKDGRLRGKHVSKFILSSQIVAVVVVGRGCRLRLA